MARYEGMDELLHRVRERLGVQDKSADPPPSPPAAVDVPPTNPAYESALEKLLLLLHDAEQLEHALDEESTLTLSAEQRDDLRAILDKAMRRLDLCRASLFRTDGPDLEAAQINRGAERSKPAGDSV